MFIKSSIQSNDDLNNQEFQFAGFSSNSSTWLPVNPNYKTLNLANEKEDENSYYALYEKLSKLKKSSHFKQANLVTKVLDEYIFAFAR